MNDEHYRTLFERAERQRLVATTQYLKYYIEVTHLNNALRRANKRIKQLKKRLIYVPT